MVVVDAVRRISFCLPLQQYEVSASRRTTAVAFASSIVSRQASVLKNTFDVKAFGGRPVEGVLQSEHGGVASHRSIVRKRG